MNFPLTKFDQQQIIRKVYDIDENCLRVCVVNGLTEPIPVVIVDASAVSKLVVTDEADFLAAALSTSIYTEIFTYTALEDFNIKDIKVKADTFGSFSLKINGTLSDFFQTSEFNRNVLFHFNNTVDILTSDIVSIEFRPDRIKIANYNFFMRIEANT